MTSANATSSRRGRGAPSVELFPFLAVLVCAMGALILVLMILTRQARLQATQEALGRAAKQHEDLKAERDMVRWRSEQLVASRAKTVEDLDRARLELGHVEDHTRQLREQLGRLRQQWNDLESLSAKDRRQQSGRQTELASVQTAIATARKKLDDARNPALHKPHSFSVVPYDGPNGTRRRPIYIECRVEGVILQPEGIALHPTDFAEPQGPANPLASAVRAVREYWVRHQGFDPDRSGEPYPLLLVRPEGIIAYYCARRALQAWGPEFGYELVDADWELKYPPSDISMAGVVAQALRDARATHLRAIAAAPRAYDDDDLGAANNDRFVSSVGGIPPTPGESPQPGTGAGGFGDGNTGPRGGGSATPALPYGAVVASGPGAGMLAGGPGAVPAANGLGGTPGGGQGLGGTGSGGPGYGGTGAGGLGLGGGPGAAGTGLGGTGAGGLGLSGTGTGGPGYGGTGAGGLGLGGGLGAAGTGLGGTGTGGLGLSGTGTGGPGYGGTGAGGLGLGGGPGAAGTGLGGAGAPGSGVPGAGGADATGNGGLVSGGLRPAGTGTGAAGASPGNSSFQLMAPAPALSGTGSGGSQNGSSTGVAGYGTAGSGVSVQPANGSAGQTSNASAGSNGFPAPPHETPAQTTSGSASQGAQPAPAMGIGQWEPTPPKPDDDSSDKKDKDKNKPDKARKLAETRGTDWALRDLKQGTVPLARSIRVECYGDHLVIFNQLGSVAKTIPLGPRTKTWIDPLVSAIWEQIDSWGMAGQRMRWQPELAVYVLQDGDRHFAELKTLLEGSGLGVVRKN